MLRTQNDVLKGLLEFMNHFSNVEKQSILLAVIERFSDELEIEEMDKEVNQVIIAFLDKKKKENYCNHCGC